MKSGWREPDDEDYGFKSTLPKKLARSISHIPRGLQIALVVLFLIAAITSILDLSANLRSGRENNSKIEALTKKVSFLQTQLDTSSNEIINLEIQLNTSSNEVITLNDEIRDLRAESKKHDTSSRSRHASHSTNTTENVSTNASSDSHTGIEVEGRTTPLGNVK